MNQTEAAQKVSEILGLQPVLKDKILWFELNGIDLCHVSGPEESPTVCSKHSGTNPDYLDWDRFAKRMQKELQLAQKVGAVTVPEGSVVIEEFDYSPGGKWECGHLNIDATTPLGKLEWREIIPGPRHGDDSHDLTVTINGVEIDMYSGAVAELDFEPPGKEGRWSEQFAESEDEVACTLDDWYQCHAAILAVLVS